MQNRLPATTTLWWSSPVLVLVLVLVLVPVLVPGDRHNMYCADEDHGRVQ